MILSNDQIVKILNDHSIDYFMQGGCVIAKEYYTYRTHERDLQGDTIHTRVEKGLNFIDLSGSTKKQLFDWLGY